MSVVENRREVARRMFAAEFDDASLSYSEGDEERAPNYVVTPTGARVNRLFAVGVLTEIENVNEEVLRGRIVDPSGAFVTYAGQYQPEAMAFLDRATPPAFVSLTGKARTYQPEDSDRVFTSVRPESINDVDADTRDRWVVSAAEATLERVATFAAALEMDERGDDLRRALEARGVEESLATGIPMAIDHYGTTEHYLEAVRRLAVEALDLVSGDRDSVSSLDAAPGDDGPNTLGSLPEIDLGDYSPVEPATETTDEEALEDELTAAETAESTVEDADGPAGEDAVSDGDVAAADEAAADGDAEATDADATVAESRPSDTDATDAESPTTDSPATETAASASEDATTTPEPVSDADETPDESVDETPEPAGDASSVIESEDAPTDPEPGASAGSDATGDDAGATEELGDFDGDEPAGEDEPSASADELGDFASDESPTAESDELTANGADADSADEAAASPATDEMYEMDEEERREVEEEFGTEFSTGTEVESPGEAEIDVPDADELAEEEGPAAGGVDAETATTESESEPVETAASDESETAEAESDADVDETQSVSSANQNASRSGDADEPAEDVNLEDAAVDVMSELDDGDGADREAVVAAVVEQYGADEGDVEDAIEDALMGGKCYEPAEGTLKSI